MKWKNVTGFFTEKQKKYTSKYLEIKDYNGQIRYR